MIKRNEVRVEILSDGTYKITPPGRAPKFVKSSGRPSERDAMRAARWVMRKLGQGSRSRRNPLTTREAAGLVREARSGARRARQEWGSEPLQAAYYKGEAQAAADIANVLGPKRPRRRGKRAGLRISDIAPTWRDMRVGPPAVTGMVGPGWALSRTPRYRNPRPPKGAPPCRSCSRGNHDGCRYGMKWGGGSREPVCECCFFSGNDSRAGGGGAELRRNPGSNLPRPILKQLHGQEMFHGWTGGDSRTLYIFTDERTGQSFVSPGGSKHAMSGMGWPMSVRVATRAEAEKHWQSPLHSGWKNKTNPGRRRNPQDDEIRQAMREASVQDPASIRRLAKLSLRHQSREGWEHAFDLAAQIPNGRLMRALMKLHDPGRRDWQSYRTNPGRRRNSPDDDIRSLEREIQSSPRDHTLKVRLAVAQERTDGRAAQMLANLARVVHAAEKGRHKRAGTMHLGQAFFNVVCRAMHDGTSTLHRIEHGGATVRGVIGPDRPLIYTTPRRQRGVATVVAAYPDTAHRSVVLAVGSVFVHFPSEQSDMAYQMRTPPQGHLETLAQKTAQAAIEGQPPRDPLGNPEAIFLVSWPFEIVQRAETLVQARQIATPWPMTKANPPALEPFRFSGRKSNPVARNAPSRKTIESHFGRQFAHDGKQGGSESLRRLIQAFEGARGTRRPKVRQVFEAANRLLGGHGIEGIQDHSGHTVLSYVNMGDPYISTLLWDGRRFSVGGYGDWVESYERRHARLPNPNKFSPKGPSLSIGPSGPRGPHGDDPDAQDLVDYADNTYELYGQKQSIEKNLLKKIAGKRYDYRQAPKLWLYWVQAAAQRWVREMPDGTGRPWNLVFPPLVREQAATICARHFEQLAKDGAFSSYPEQIKALAAIKGGKKANPERSRGRRLDRERFHVVAINERTGGIQYGTTTPVTHHEGSVILSKQRHPAPKGVRYQLLPASGRLPQCSDPGTQQTCPCPACVSARRTTNPRVENPFGGKPWTRSNTRLDVHEERDNLDVVLWSKIGGGVIGEWHDDDARQMFEDGFFKARDLHGSVVAYANEMGLRPTRGRGRPARGRRSNPKGDRADMRQNCDIYIGTLRSPAKRAYARAYCNWVLGGQRTHPSPSEFHLGGMGAQAVRMEVAQIVGPAAIDEAERRWEGKSNPRGSGYASVKQVKLQGDYDSKSRYWGGHSPGSILFVQTTGDGYEVYVRARDRHEAMEKFARGEGALAGGMSLARARDRDREDYDPRLANPRPAAGMGPACRRCKGTEQVRLGKNLVKCPLCCRKANPVLHQQGSMGEETRTSAVVAYPKPPSREMLVSYATGVGTDEGVKIRDKIAEEVMISDIAPSGSRKRNPLASHKPGCKCIFHSGKMGRKKATA